MVAPKQDRKKASTMQGAKWKLRKILLESGLESIVFVENCLFKTAHWSLPIGTAHSGREGWASGRDGRVGGLEDDLGGAATADNEVNAMVAGEFIERCGVEAHALEVVDSRDFLGFFVVVGEDI